MLVVDTCVVIDVADDDPNFGAASADCLAEHLADGLQLSPISYVELAPVFDHSPRLLDRFLDAAGIAHHAVFNLTDRKAAFRGWGSYVAAKRAGRVSPRPVADALIGALALRSGGLITRNPRDFRAFYPDLTIIDPTRGRR